MTATTKRMVSVIGVACIAVFLFFSGIYVFAQSYDGRIAPNVSIGSLDVGGMDPEMARQKLHERIDAFLLDGIEVALGDDTATLALTSIGTSDQDASATYVALDVDDAVEEAMRAHRQGPAWLEPLRLLWSYLKREEIGLSGFLDDARLLEALRNAFPNAEHPVANAGFQFEKTPDGWIATVTQSANGSEFDLDEFLVNLEGRLSDLTARAIPLSVLTIEPEVLEAGVEPLLQPALNILRQAPYTLTYDPDRYTHKEWVVTDELLTASLRAVKEPMGDAAIGLSPENLEALYEAIAQVIERPASDARFAIENGRVTEFVASSVGTSLDRVGTTIELEKLIGGDTIESKETALVVNTIEPDVATGEVNDVGIKEALGVGTSNYRGSPANRIKNIRNGVRLLNGILIQPDETFSLLNALKPFDSENGYLPELVIKGDKIVPEIGGGLCQIGTTTFRATMNSGLPITQRQNHSLVVRYYNDPSNGNPGTDATIYDPAPDFQFRNDTGNPILFQAEMDEENTELRFTFWGTSDGRKGSYTPPELIRWIAAGESRDVETEDLPPGERQCQSAHVGADAKFTYTIERPDGEKEQTVFESHYRPLPEICLVGKDPEISEETTEQDAAEAKDDVNEGNVLSTDTLLPEDENALLSE